MTFRILALPLLLALATPAAGQEFKVVAHPDQAAGGLATARVSRLFLKKETLWPDGALVKPVVPPDGPLYRAFCQRIHGRPATAIFGYWNQMIFSGKEVPPRELRTAAEILDYVRTTPGAIGVVPAETTVPADVRTVVVRD